MLELNGRMISQKRREGRMILASLPGLGPVSVRKLDAQLPEGAEALLGMDPARRAAWCHPNVCRELAAVEDYLPLARVRSTLAEMPADYVIDEDEAYPCRLLPYPDRPLGLYRYRAQIPLGARCFAIVGTRRPSAYGRKQARIFATGLAGAGFTIVSGMAEGIDTEAHRGALAAGGRTAAFLGGGLKRCYPASNRELMEEIALSAGVWSEFPLWRCADRRSFPQRNRIVSGVSEGVLVVESGLSGGSLITARMAAEQGKPVYVLPGRVDAPESAGCHALLRDGAQLVTCVADILEDLRSLPEAFAVPRGTPCQVESSPPLEGTAAAVWTLIQERDAVSLEGLATGLQCPVHRLGPVLIQLEVEGRIAKRLDGRYECA